MVCFIRKPCIHLRNRNIFKLSVMIPHMSLDHCHLNMQILKIVKHSKIRLISRHNRTSARQMKISGRMMGSRLNSNDRIHFIFLDCLTDNGIHMSNMQQIIRMLVICTEHTMLIVLRHQKSGKSSQISCCRSLTDHDILPSAEFFQGFLHG